MHKDSLVFSHQQETVRALAQLFELVYVFTPETGSEILPNNVNVLQIPWKRNSFFVNIHIIYRTLIPFMIRHRDAIVFTHMADVHAALLAPFTRLLGMRHVLWYAHATNSIYLKWASFFLSNIVSSTRGSCNLRFNKKKIKYINQGINESDFRFHKKKLTQFNKALYYGRLDESKNIHLMLRLIARLRGLGDSMTIDIYGKPANNQSSLYLERLKSESTFESLANAVEFKGPIERNKVPELAKNYHFFLNLFTGSLDKTLIEATLLGLPVITWNLEYCSQFGSWSKQPVRESIEFILEEIQSLRSRTSVNLEYEIESRVSKAIHLHSFDAWIMRLFQVLNEGN